MVNSQLFLPLNYTSEFALAEGFEPSLGLPRQINSLLPSSSRPNQNLFEPPVGLEPTYIRLEAVDISNYVKEACGVGNGDRTHSIPAWQAGAPPFMRHPQISTLSRTRTYTPFLT